MKDPSGRGAMASEVSINTKGLTVRLSMTTYNAWIVTHDIKVPNPLSRIVSVKPQDVSDMIPTNRFRAGCFALFRVGVIIGANISCAMRIGGLFEHSMQWKDYSLF